MSKADLSKQPAQVAAMFDQVSTRYDRTNAVLSVGNAALWRVATTRAVDPRAGETILDVAAGTGTSSASLARNGASVVAEGNCVVVICNEEVCVVGGWLGTAATSIASEAWALAEALEESATLTVITECVAAVG